jgi:pyrroline-5-carboxylate reductase
LPTPRWRKQVPARTVRAMPNLPALVRRGVTAICGGARATAADLALADSCSRPWASRCACRKTR